MTSDSAPSSVAKARSVAKPSVSTPVSRVPGGRPPRTYSIKEFSESLTQQQFKAECDIHTILKQFARTGEISHLARAKAQFADVSNLGSYKESLNTVIAAQDAFLELPALVRKRFSNDPAEFVKFASDPRNGEELVRLGLATKVDKKISEPSAPSSSDKTGGGSPQPVPPAGGAPK